MAIVKRTIKGIALTYSELDGNFDHLDAVKLNKSLLEGGNRVLVQVESDGEPTAILIPAGYVLGRLTGGQLAAIPMGSIEVSGATTGYVLTQVGIEEAARIVGDASTLSAAQAYADGVVVGLWNDRGNHDASGSAYPSTGGSGASGAIRKGDTWTISVAGTLPTGQVVNVGDTVRAKVNTPGNTQANWAILENNIGYFPQNIVEKDASNGYVGLSGWSIKFRNLANTFTSLLQNAATAVRTYTFPDYDGTIATLAGTETLTNKRVNPRVQTVASSATVTPNADSDDSVVIIAQEAALTLANPSGTPVDMQPMMIRIKDNGTPKAITYGTQYRPIGIVLPLLTVTSKTIYLGLMWNDANSKWDVLGVNIEA